MAASADRSPALTRFSAALGREILVCVAVGAPALTYVLATNTTASVPLILLHAALLGGFAPTLVSALEAGLPAPASRVGWPSLGRALAIRVLGLLLATAATLALIAALTPLPLEALVGSPLLVSLLPVFLAYALVALGAQWSALREHALRAEANEARARQAALAARIRPHFLFNALNCIEELADTDGPAARLAVGRLSRLLRAVLHSSARPMGRLEDEARLVDDYLALEKVRFGDRFGYRLDLAPEVLARELPATVLLTLAENAVKHGVEATRGPARVVLTARRRDDGALAVTLSGPAADRAPSPSPPGADGGGYGLSDVRERLRLAYGGRAAFSLLSSNEGESRVELVLPQ